MGDDKSKKGYQDDIRVDPNDPNEVAYAAKAFGVSKKKVLIAIYTVGTYRKDIEAYLASHSEEEE